MGGKVNDEQHQFDVTNNIDSNREGGTDKSETEYTKHGHVADSYDADSYDADSECLKVYKMRFADFRRNWQNILTFSGIKIKYSGRLEPAWEIPLTYVKNGV